MNYDNIILVYDIIREIIPEEKKDDFNLLYNFCLSKVKHNEQQSCCNWRCTWSISLLIFLFILWTGASVFLFALGLALLALSFGFRILCCCYHICYEACCTSHTTDEDKGSYILRTITVDVGAQRRNEAAAEDHDEILSFCGAGSLTCAILLIPAGYKKILSWFDDWRSN